MLDAQRGYPRPRVVASYVAVTDRDLRALQTIIGWCDNERAELSQYDPDIRHVEPPARGLGKGTPGIWRIDEADLRRQVAAWSDPNRGKPKP